MSEKSVETSHGRIAYAESGGQGPAVLMVHGNSSAKEIFARQFDSELGATYRLIAMDLPGHGESEDARDPSRTYSIHGFADAAMEFLDNLGVGKAVIIGWSLGGHIALEMAARWPGTQGAWITGTPPTGASAEDMMAAFLPSDEMGFTFKPEFTPDEARQQAHNGIGTHVPLEDWMVGAAIRADGRFRPMMLESAMAGLDMDQKEIVATSPLPLAVVTGEKEPFVNNEYLVGLTYRNLWDGKVHVLAGLGHTPFWEAPETVNPMIGRFLDEVTG